VYASFLYRLVFVCMYIYIYIYIYIYVCTHTNIYIYIYIYIYIHIYTRFFFFNKIFLVRVCIRILIRTLNGNIFHFAHRSNSRESSFALECRRNGAECSLHDAARHNEQRVIFVSYKNKGSHEWGQWSMEMYR
jgi:hypothetical protein